MDYIKPRSVILINADLLIMHGLRLDILKIV